MYPKAGLQERIWVRILVASSSVSEPESASVWEADPVQELEREHGCGSGSGSGSYSSSGSSSSSYGASDASSKVGLYVGSCFGSWSRSGGSEAGSSTGSHAGSRVGPGWAAAKGMARPEGVAVVRHMAEVPVREVAPEDATPPVKAVVTMRDMAEATTIEKTSPKDDKINVTMRS